MRSPLVLSLALAAGFTARADFRYTTTTKAGGGMLGGLAAAAERAQRPTRHLLKGDKLKIDHSDFAIIMDFGAQTVIQLNHTQKTYQVTSFQELAAKTGQTGAEVHVDVQDTGERKTINGYKARLLIFTADVDSPQMRRPGADMKMRMTIEMWVSSDVPGASEVQAFYQKNAARAPWRAMLGRQAADSGMGKAMADVLRKAAAVHGVPVLQVMKMGAVGNDPRLAQARQQMAEARARLEEMRRKGGPEGQLAADALARMGNDASPATLMETTIESGNFSTDPIPASEFEVPPGYQKAAQ